VTLVATAIDAMTAEIYQAARALGSATELNLSRATSRAWAAPLQSPGIWSSNRVARLVRAADGWLAVNPPRQSDLEMIPAWLECTRVTDPWRSITRIARRSPSADMVARARLLGMPVSRVGEIRAADWRPLTRPFGRASRRPGPPRPRVVDLTSLWAGPLCGRILADNGGVVTKIESSSRPDVMRDGAPAFFDELNGDKTLLTLDFQRAADHERLREALDSADVVITSARPRAFDQLGLSPERVFHTNPTLVWVAITGHGWTGEAANWVGFGDDTAAAGDLVRRTRSGAPRFAGDALSDPLTGLAAAYGAMRALAEGGGVLIDAAMSRTSAGAVSVFARGRAAP